MEVPWTTFCWRRFRSRRWRSVSIYQKMHTGCKIHRGQRQHTSFKFCAQSKKFSRRQSYYRPNQRFHCEHNQNRHELRRATVRFESDDDNEVGNRLGVGFRIGGTRPFTAKRSKMNKLLKGRLHLSNHRIWWTAALSMGPSACWNSLDSFDPDATPQFTSIDRDQNKFTAGS